MNPKTQQQEKKSSIALNWIEKELDNLREENLEVLLEIREKIDQIIKEKQLEKLYPDSESYQYTQQQALLFEEKRSQLLSKYSGKYVWFEDGNVIDFDNDEEALLIRVIEQKNPSQKSVFVTKVTP